MMLFPVAAESAATVPRGFVGVMADGPLLSADVELGREVDLMAAAGVEAIRVASSGPTPSRTRRARRSRPGMSTSTECPRALPAPTPSLPRRRGGTWTSCRWCWLAPHGRGKTRLRRGRHPHRRLLAICQLHGRARRALQGGRDLLGAPPRSARPRYTPGSCGTSRMALSSGRSSRALPATPGCSAWLARRSNAPTPEARSSWPA